MSVVRGGPPGGPGGRFRGGLRYGRGNQHSALRRRLLTKNRRQLPDGGLYGRRVTTRRGLNCRTAHVR